MNQPEQLAAGRQGHHGRPRQGTTVRASRTIQSPAGQQLPTDAQGAQPRPKHGPVEPTGLFKLNCAAVCQTPKANR